MLDVDSGSSTGISIHGLPSPGQVPPPIITSPIPQEEASEASFISAFGPNTNTNPNPNPNPVPDPATCNDMEKGRQQLGGVEISSVELDRGGVGVGAGAGAGVGVEVAGPQSGRGGGNGSTGNGAHIGEDGLAPTPADTHSPASNGGANPNPEVVPLELRGLGGGDS
ncbi:unnamed protein product, partial [Discosporangium mesarthrocarpum]